MLEAWAGRRDCGSERGGKVGVEEGILGYALALALRAALVERGSPVTWLGSNGYMNGYTEGSGTPEPAGPRKAAGRGEFDLFPQAYKVCYARCWRTGASHARSKCPLKIVRPEAQTSTSVHTFQPSSSPFLSARVEMSHGGSRDATSLIRHVYQGVASFMSTGYEQPQSLGSHVETPTPTPTPTLTPALQVGTAATVQEKEVARQGCGGSTCFWVVSMCGG
eukprot:365175-Chlamydomonas_euryale.AAC.4